MNQIESVNRELIDRQNTTENVNQQFLTFNLENEVYGINILNVVEIITPTNITEVPQQANYVKGILNLRGNIIPIINVRLRFELTEKEFDKRTCIIVVSLNNEEVVGLVVDSVHEVTEISNKQLEPMPSVAQSGQHRFVEAIGKVGNTVNIILNLQKLLHDTEEDELPQ